MARLSLTAPTRTQRSRTESSRWSRRYQRPESSTRSSSRHCTRSARSSSPAAACRATSTRRNSLPTLAVRSARRSSSDASTDPSATSTTRSTTRPARDRAVAPAQVARALGTRIRWRWAYRRGFKAFPRRLQEPSGRLRGGGALGRPPRPTTRSECSSCPEPPADLSHPDGGGRPRWSWPPPSSSRLSPSPRARAPPPRLTGSVPDPPGALRERLGLRQHDRPRRSAVRDRRHRRVGQAHRPTHGRRVRLRTGLPPRVLGIGGAVDVAFLAGHGYALVTMVGGDFVGGRTSATRSWGSTASTAVAIRRRSPTSAPGPSRTHRPRLPPHHRRAVRHRAVPRWVPRHRRAPQPGAPGHSRRRDHRGRDLPQRGSHSSRFRAVVWVAQAGPVPHVAERTILALDRAPSRRSSHGRPPARRRGARTAAPAVCPVAGRVERRCGGVARSSEHRSTHARDLGRRTGAGHRRGRAPARPRSTDLGRVRRANRVCRQPQRRRLHDRRSVTRGPGADRGRTGRGRLQWTSSDSQ